MTANHIARMSAKRLMPEFGDTLPLTVEQVIQSAPAVPGEFIDLNTPAAISALIVQCAQLAFDLKRSKDGGAGKLRSSSPEGANKLDKEGLRHELRLELGLPENVSEKTRDVVIDAVAEERKPGNKGSVLAYLACVRCVLPVLGRQFAAIFGVACSGI